MPQVWKPDTCKCIIITDENGAVLQTFKKHTTFKCPDHADLDTFLELYPYVIAENQSANELYINWTPEEIDENINFIKEYKETYDKILDPIRDLKPADAKLAYSARLSLKVG